MKRILIVSLVMLAGGAAAGWFWGYTRPVSYYARNFKKITGLSDQEIAKMATSYKKLTADTAHEESYVAAINLGVLDMLEAGDTDAAKQFLAKQVGSYYRIYSKQQHASSQRDALLARIEKTSERSPLLKAALTQNTE